jgi:hypothetical protein
MSASKQPGTLKKKPTVTAAKAQADFGRTFGKLKVASRPRCYAKCTGTYSHGIWIHTKGCPYTPVLWKIDGYTNNDWECVYGCTPVETPSSFIHHYYCPFWTSTGETPFGLKEPKASNEEASG